VYVILDKVGVPNGAMDPAFGLPNLVYASLRDKVAARADHVAPQYRIDNAQVVELLKEAVG
jgi:hypothetical protein